MITPKGKRKVKLSIPGIHNVYNALAAAGWGLAEGLDLDDVVKGIEAFKDMPGLVEQLGFVNSILVKDILDSDLDEIEKVFESLEDRDGIVTVLCMDESKDIDKYKRLGDIIGQHGGHCIIIHDYFSNSNMNEMEAAVEKKMGNVKVHHQTDYYKAIQKATTFLPRGGHILLVRG